VLKKIMFAALAVVIIGIVAAGCGSSSSSSSSSATASGTESEGSSGSESSPSEESSSSEEAESAGEAEFNAKSPGGVISSLPKEVQPAYDGFDAGVEESPWVNFKPKHGPPWTVGYASGYAGNSWRAGTLEGLERAAEKYEKAGLINKLLVTQANLNDTVQIEQMHQLIDQGADVLVTCCASAALKQAAEYAGQHGVPVVTYSGYIDSKYSLNQYPNYLKIGFDMANFIAQQMGGEGNLLYVNGIPGAASNTSVDKGVEQALEQYPDVKVVGTVSGEWTDQIAKTKVLQFLATHPEEINGVVVQPAEEVGTMQAFLQSGRPLPPMTQGGEKGTACYWREHPDWKTRVFNLWPPGEEGEGAMDTVIKVLQGQGPKIESITKIAPSSGLEEVEKELEPKCDEGDTTWFEPGNFWSEEYLDNFFEHPKPVLGG